MKVTLTLDFTSTEELQNFLNNRGSAPVASTNHDAGAQPTKLEAVPLPDAVPAAVADPSPIVDPVEYVTEALDSDDLRAKLMIRLRELAGGMEDPAVLGKFINGFGVARFSEIADEDLPAFQTSLDIEFPVT